MAKALPDFQPGPSGLPKIAIKRDWNYNPSTSIGHLQVAPGPSRPNIRVIPQSTLGADNLSSVQLLLPRAPTGDLSSSSAGLLGRMVGSPSNNPSIGGSMMQSLNALMNSASTLNINSVSNGIGSVNNAVGSAGEEDPSVGSSSSRTTSPPSLTSPNSLVIQHPYLNSPQFPVSAFPGSILSNQSLASIMALPTNSTTSNFLTLPASVTASLASTLGNASAFNSIYTANLPNTAFSNSTSSPSPPGTSGMPVLISSSSPGASGSFRVTPKPRGGGRGRGGGLVRRGGSNSGLGPKNKVKRVELCFGEKAVQETAAVGVELTDAAPPSTSSPLPTITISSSTCDSASPTVTIENTTDTNDCSQKISASYAPVSADGASSPEKHIKKVVINIP